MNRLRQLGEHVDYDNFILLSGILAWGALQLIGFSVIESALSAIAVMFFVLVIRSAQKIH